MSTDRQEEIIQVSLEIISTRGIQGLTVKNISRRIGISEPALYRHFENKIGILSAILDHFKSSGEKMFRQQAVTTDTALKRIEKIFLGHFEAFEKNPSLVTVIFSEEIFRNEPALQDKINRIMDQNSLVIKSLVAEGQAKGEIRSDIESKYLTLLIIGTLRMLVKKWQMGDKTFNHREEVHRVFKTISKLITIN